MQLVTHPTSTEGPVPSPRDAKKPLAAPVPASAARSSSDPGTGECFYALSSFIAQISDSYSRREVVLLLGRKRRRRGFS